MGFGLGQQFFRGFGGQGFRGPALYFQLPNQFIVAFFILPLQVVQEAAAAYSCIAGRATPIREIGRCPLILPRASEDWQ